MTFLRLKFEDPELEAAWTDATDAKSLPVAFLGMLVFGVVLLIGIVGDIWQAYEGWQQVAFVRATVWVVPRQNSVRGPEAALWESR